MWLFPHRMDILGTGGQIMKRTYPEIVAFARNIAKESGKDIVVYQRCLKWYQSGSRYCWWDADDYLNLLKASKVPLIRLLLITAEGTIAQ